MVDDKLLSLVEKAIGQNISYTDNHGNARVFCPFCHHHKTSLEINLDPDSGITKKGHDRFQSFHCWVCGTRGFHLIELFKRLRCSPVLMTQLSQHLESVGYVQTLDHAVKRMNDDLFVEEDVPVVLPPEFVPYHKFDSLPEADQFKLFSFLQSRKISLFDIVKHNIGYCNVGEYENRVVIPSYDSTNQLNYWVARSMGYSKLKYVNPNSSKDVIIFEDMIDWRYPVVLVEGVFDAISTRFNSTPILGHELQPSLLMKLSLHHPDVFVCLDNDAWSYSFAIARTCLNYGCRVKMVSLPEKDPNDLGFDATWECIEAAPYIDFEQLIEMQMEA